MTVSPGQEHDWTDSSMTRLARIRGLVLMVIMVVFAWEMEGQVKTGNSKVTFGVFAPSVTVMVLFCHAGQLAAVSIKVM